MPYGLFFELERSYQSLVIEAAAAIAALEPKMVVAGGATPPHLTVLHFDAPEGVAEELHRQLADSPLSAIAFVAVQGVCVTRVEHGNYYFPGGGLQAKLMCKKSRGLKALHREALERAEALGCHPLGAVGRNYSPHVTLGFFGPKGSLSLGAATLAYPRELPVAFAWGRLGRYGTFPG